MTACSGSKRVVENNANKTESVSITENDSVKIIESSNEIERPLNSQDDKNIPKEANSVNIQEDSSGIHIIWNNLLAKHVSDKGLADYKGFKSDWSILKAYFIHLNDNIPNLESSKEEKLAYWINAYNAFTIDLILKNYPLKSIKDIKDPWEQRLWKLGNKWYNLDDIEHQILRKMNEPRIHFAIVCASYSCPKLQNEAFKASMLNEQLNKATKAFLNDSERNNISKEKLELSKIFQWFGKDFKQKGSLIDFLNIYSEKEIAEDAKISFKKYNWDLNE